MDSTVAQLTLDNELTYGDSIWTSTGFQNLQAQNLIK